jgi:hypothetical protein
MEVRLAVHLIEHFLRANGPSGADAVAVWQRSLLRDAAHAAAARVAVLTPYRCWLPAARAELSHHVSYKVPHT